MRTISFILALFFTSSMSAINFSVVKGQTVQAYLQKGVEPVAETALEILSSDFKDVMEIKVERCSKVGQSQIAATIDKSMAGRHEAFRLTVDSDGRLNICGSDSHGLAYGLLEVSRMLGVSPWEWWADCAPKQQDFMRVDERLLIEKAPAVEYRGIFINDEDWGLTPWSYENHEPNDKGVVGPKTTSRIFELLLRLRANTYWPPMHECTRPFFLTDGNRAIAKKYGIYIGASHCEPMACNVNGEWKVRGNGEYDYLHNESNVRDFWEKRVEEVAGQPIIYTLGMRGVHDGAMQGAKTVEEQKGVLQRVLADQREMLSRHVNKDVSAIPQVFIPYKEVLDIYNAGLDVPDDVCLMWCDDNYGYITHTPTAAEKMRKGGSGVYYHVSYWGRPHDYLWLGTFSPALLYQQMQTAYNNGMRKIWILNVGDIKPAEYQTEMFMDLAWEGEMNPSIHLQNFLQREFGKEIAERLMPIMNEYYRLAYIAKPEFLGGTRTEESDRKYWNTVRDLPWSDDYCKRRIASYEVLEEEIERIWGIIPPSRLDAFLQLVKYPIQACSEMNKKLLYAQLARHSADAALWKASEAAFDSIASLTQIYNDGISNGGKWRLMMDFQPRRMPVFAKIGQDNSESGPTVNERDTLIRFNAIDSPSSDALVPWDGLGYEGGAAEIREGMEAHYSFTLPNVGSDSVDIELHLLPTHPDALKRLQVEVAFDQCEPVVCDYATHGRSEEWKRNVLRSQAIRTVKFPLAGNGRHSIKVKALSGNVILDQVFVF